MVFFKTRVMDYLLRENTVNKRRGWVLVKNEESFPAPTNSESQGVRLESLYFLMSSAGESEILWSVKLWNRVEELALGNSVIIKAISRPRKERLW